MKHPDYDKAFAPTPEIVSLSIEAAFRKGEKAMKFRHKLTAMLSAAAVIAVACAAAVFALPNEPRPDVVSQPVLNNATAAPDATLTPRPMPTAAATAEPTPPPIPQEEQIVYFTPKGNYYHFDEHCSGMQGAEPHSIPEAQYERKEPCPVCILTNEEYERTVFPAPTPSNETTFVLTDEQPTPADRASDIFLNVFGAYIFDEFEEYEYVSAEAYGLNTDEGYLLEEIEFHFAKDGEFTPVSVTVESREDKIKEGTICLAPPEEMNFDWTGFCESCSPWFQKACENVPATLDMFSAMDAAFEDELESVTQVCVSFDSQLKPSVCGMEFTTYFGSFYLSFDINGNDVSLASMNYNVSRA